MPKTVNNWIADMIEVFKTNVNEAEHADMLLGLFRSCFPGCRINFDLDDCDRVLRVEGASTVPIKVMELMHQQGFQCCVMED